MENNHCMKSELKRLEFSDMMLNINSSISFDFGRESLGILPPDFEAGSQDFLALKTTFNFPFMEDDIGKESLGILPMTLLDTTLGPRLCQSSEISLINGNNESACDILNNAFLYTSPRKLSLKNSYFPFTNDGCDETTKIYSTGFSCENSFMSPSYSNKLKLFEIQKYLRIKSLPELEANHNETINIPFMFNSKWSKDNPNSVLLTANEYVNNIVTKDASQCENVGEFDENYNKSCTLNDSVFLEGKQTTQKMASESIFNDSFDNDEIPILENEPNPKWPEIVSSPEEQHQENKVESENTSLCEKFSETKSENEPVCCTPKSAKEILHDLSEIFNNTTPSDSQRSHGNQLLNSLAELLNSKTKMRPRNVDDSGHSSFINDESCLKTTSDESTNSFQKNLSSDLHSRSSDKVDTLTARPNIKRAQNIFGRRKIPKITLNINNNSNQNNEAASNENVCTANTITNPLNRNLKVKARTVSLQRGPLKATIPMKDLKKTAKPSTPERNEGNPSMMQQKKTSTPNEPKLKPVASSTPTSRLPSRSSTDRSPLRKSLPSPAEDNSKVKNRRSLPSPAETANNKIKNRASLPAKASPLSRSYGENSSKQSTSTHYNKSSLYSKSFQKDKSVSNSPATNNTHLMERRNSTSSLKKEILTRPRSNSLPKEPVGIMKSLKKIRENLLNSPEFKEMNRKKILKESNISTNLSEGNNSEHPICVKRGLVSNFKKMGKENKKN